MKFSRLLCAGLLALIFLWSCKSTREKARVLVFSKTSDFHHESIPKGIAAIMGLGAENDFQVDTTKNADLFTDSILQNYSALIFLNTTGNVLDIRQQIAMERFIQAGGGFVGIHAATDTEYDWGWYGNLIGGYFNGHPKIQQATLHVTDKTNPATSHLPENWTRTDEWYNFKKLRKDLKILLTIDEKTYQGGTNGNEHPMAWYHDFDGGRSFYTELGHTDESYTDPLYLKHILGGIKYAIGKNKELDFSSAESQYPPDEDRFIKTTLSQGGFYEPTELTVLPNLDILISQRRGEILLYKNDSKQVKQAGFLNVYFKTEAKGINAEEGLLGIKADPDFSKNHWVYLFYSPADTSVNRLSRFTLANDSIDPRSEKIILQFYSQRDICCHTGGSVAFGPNRTLFVSAGDNSTPFDEPNQRFVSHGFAPLNDAPGHLQYDARRSAGNTNDLRGKILRINIKDDGTYTIPSDNLFPGKSDKTRPEIYVMGNRNPYRISVDPKNGYLYWGEVGPDARNDSLETRGPRGYDEFNQAKKAGYYGWPLFVGNNFPYRQYDYLTGKSGAPFDPAKPVNNSLNNTGLTNLPPAQAPFIWYDYGNSTEFPEVGNGGRTAMAGPAYYVDMWPKSTRYPDYYDKKVFIYEWIRGWIMAVSLNRDGDFDKMEPFIPSIKFSAPIDMELGPDGRLYILEYGNGWFTKNPDAGISRIDYNSGNRPPKILSPLTVDKTSGSLPLKVTASVNARDPENDKLLYHWNLGDGVTKETNTPSIDYTYTRAGEFGITVDVSDDKKATAKSGLVLLNAGNEAPTVDVSIAGNKTFYFVGKPVEYKVDIKDKEDSVAKNAAGKYVLADFVDAVDKAAVPMGHLSLSETDKGKNLMLAADCKTCHQISNKSIGPAFEQVSAKYRKDPKAFAYLTEKVKKGGNGVWGETSMPAHPDMPVADVQQIIRWIYTLNAGAKKASLPLVGKVATTGHEKGSLYLTASYTDQGGPAGGNALSAKKTVTLRSNLLTVQDVRKVIGFTRVDTAGVRYLTFPAGEGSFAIEKIDLNGLNALELGGVVLNGGSGEYSIELHIDGKDGALFGKSKVSIKGGTKTFKISVPLEGTPGTDLHDLYVVVKTEGNPPAGVVRLATIKVIGK